MNQDDFPLLKTSQELSITRRTDPDLFWSRKDETPLQGLFTCPCRLAFFAAPRTCWVDTRPARVILLALEFVSSFRFALGEGFRGSLPWPPYLKSPLGPPSDPVVLCNRTWPWCYFLWLDLLTWSISSRRPGAFCTSCFFHGSQECLTHFGGQ